MDERLQQAKLDEVLGYVKKFDPHNHTETGFERYPVEKCIHHYTTAQGLIGILENRCLWGTHYKFLNDVSEMEYGVALIERSIEERILELRDVVQETVKIIFQNAARAMYAHWDIYFACMCKDGNLLSQWREYSKGGGYSIALKPRLLEGQSKPVIPPPEVWKIGLAKVIYDPNKQAAMMRAVQVPVFRYLEDLIRQAYAEAVDGMAPMAMAEVFDKWMTPAAGELMFALFQMAYRFKDRCFADEQEWRFVHLRQNSDLEIVKFRSSDGAIVPYVEFPIHLEDETEFGFDIHSITCGPNVATDQNEKSVRMLLDKHGFQGVEVKSSTIPTRH